jgi:signal transduction histidine kinase
MNSKPVRILLVEDNPGDARLIREMLAAAVGGEFAVEWVPNLGDGLRRLGRKEIDLVLLDLGLPDSQGLDTFVSACAQAPQVPIVVLSGLADETLAVTAVRQGAQDYLIKGEVDSLGLGRAIRYATERKQAEEALKESAQKLRYLTSRLFTAQEDERKRISRELHDELGHALLALKLQTESVGEQLLPQQVSLKTEVSKILGFIGATIEEVRRLYLDLSPGDLEDLGLTTALHSLVDDFADLQKQINWTINIDDLDGLFPLPTQTAIYRVVQEALTNIGKHAKPRHVSLEIKRGEQGVSFGVADDGLGFERQKVVPEKKNLGLLAMEERVKMLGGSFELWSQKDRGTRISFTIPIPEGS